MLLLSRYVIVVRCCFCDDVVYGVVNSVGVAVADVVVDVVVAAGIVVVVDARCCCC